MTTKEIDTSPAEAQEAEVEAEETGHYVTVSLCGKPVRVVPATAWRMSWQRKLRQGDFDAFVEEILHPDDVDIYFDADPTAAEFNQFMEDCGELGGESLGKSSGPSRSSRRTRRR
jgi:hypothetical protein